MLQNSCVHPQGDSYICSMVCFTGIGVSCLVDRRECSSWGWTHEVRNL